MYTLLLIVHVIVSLFLIFIILVQSSKGEGLADVFGGGSSQTTIFGTRTGSFLTKATTASAIIFMITCLALAFMSREKGKSIMEQDLLKQQTMDTVKDLMGGKKNTAETVDVEQTAPLAVVPEHKDTPAAAGETVPAAAVVEQHTVQSMPVVTQETAPVIPAAQVPETATETVQQ
jgi:preprotein translocase subunit SecG